MNDETQVFSQIPPENNGLHGQYVQQEPLDEVTRGKLEANARHLLAGQSDYTVNGTPLNSPIFTNLQKEAGSSGPTGALPPLPNRHVLTDTSSFEPETGQFGGLTRPVPKVITICGSMRFYDEIMELARDLTMEGHMVYAPFINMEYETQRRQLNQEEAEAIKVHLDRLHICKINASQEVHVVVVDNYVGSSTQSEITHASAQGKVVIFHDKTRPVFPTAGQWHPGDNDDDVTKEYVDQQHGVDPQYLPDPHLTYDDVVEHHRQQADGYHGHMDGLFDKEEARKAADPRNAEMTAMIDRSLEPQTRMGTAMLPVQNGDPGSWQDGASATSGEIHTGNRASRRAKRHGNQ